MRTQIISTVKVVKPLRDPWPSNSNPARALLATRRRSLTRPGSCSRSGVGVTTWKRLQPRVSPSQPCTSFSTPMRAALAAITVGVGAGTRGGPLRACWVRSGRDGSSGARRLALVVEFGKILILGPADARRRAAASCPAGRACMPAVKGGGTACASPLVCSARHGELRPGLVRIGADLLSESTVRDVSRVTKVRVKSTIHGVAVRDARTSACSWHRDEALARHSSVDVADLVCGGA